MGNAYIEKDTKELLLRFMNNNDPPIKSVSRGIEELLYRDSLLDAYKRENKWLSQLVVMYDKSNHHD